MSLMVMVPLIIQNGFIKPLFQMDGGGSMENYSIIQIVKTIPMFKMVIYTSSQKMKHIQIPYRGSLSNIPQQGLIQNLHLPMVG